MQIYNINSFKCRKIKLTLASGIKYNKDEKQKLRLPSTAFTRNTTVIMR